MNKKYLSIALAIAMAASVLAGCVPEKANSGSTSTGTAGQTGAGAKLFDKPVTISMLVPANPTFPYKEDWYIVDAIKQKTNVTLKVDAVLNSNSAFDIKLNLVMASGDLPDIIAPIGDDAAKKYGSQGAFVNAYDKANMAKMPNFKAWADANKDYVSNFISADGKVFMYPAKGLEEGNRRGWMYRKDIFDKNGIAQPKDDQELYTALKKLKQVYPNSYPMAFRTTGLSQFMMIAPSWGTDYEDTTHQLYYNTAKKDFVYGPTEDNFKEMVKFYNKLYVEKLIPPNILTLDVKGWQDMMSNSDSFVTIDFLTRIDFFNVPMRKTDPSFSLEYMKPVKGGTNGADKFAHSATGVYGMLVAAKSKQVDNVLKYVDWFYTKEGAEITSWGEEGKTYNTVNGQKKFIGDNIDVATIRKNTGLGTYGVYQLFDYASHISTFSKEVQAAFSASVKSELSPYIALAFTPQEQDIVNTVGVNIDKATAQQTSKFIIGERSIDEWDKYVKEINDLGLDKLKDVYVKAYARQQAAKSQ